MPPVDAAPHDESVHGGHQARLLDSDESNTEPSMTTEEVAEELSYVLYGYIDTMFQVARNNYRDPFVAYTVLTDYLMAWDEFTQ